MAAITFSGIASGIDSKALIDSLIAQKRKARIEPLEAKIESYTDTNSSLEKLSKLLKTLKSAASNFRDINGGAIRKLVSSSDETVASATATGAATNSTYALNVTQIARSGTQSFNDRFSSGSSALKSTLVGTGYVSVTVGTGGSAESHNIAVDSSTTADEFIEEFNSQSTKATASLVNTSTSSTPSYAIVITSNSEGSEQGQVSVSADATLTSQGLFTAATLNQAQNAQFTLSGVNGTITRSSNSISDLVSGLTFSLTKVGSSNITVSDDAEGTSAVIQEFVDAYNEVIDYISENDFVLQETGDNGEINSIFGPLSGTSLDENLLSALRSGLSSSGTTGRSINVTADLGITTDRDGKLLFDSDKLKTALSSDSEGVSIITANLGETLASVDGTIAQFTRFNGLIDTSVSSSSGEISSLQARIAEIEEALLKETQTLAAQYARLEANIGTLQSQSAKLSSLIPG